MEKRKSIYKNAIYKILLNVFNILVPLIIGAYSYRVLKQENMGRINHCDAIYGYFLIFAAFGIYQYGLRETSRVRDDKKKIKKVFTSLFVIGLVSNIIVFISFLIFINIGLKGDSKYPILMLYSINLFANTFYVEWANEALENYGFITVKTILIRLIYLVGLFTFVKTENDYLYYVFLLTLSTFLNYFVSFIYITKKIGFDFKELTIGRHIKPLLFSLVMANANVLYTQLDRLMLGWYNLEIELANYGLSQSMVIIVNTIILSVVYVTIPRLSNILASDDENAYCNLLNKVIQTLVAFLFPAAIGIFVLSKEVVLIWGGVDFADASGALKIFTFYMISLGFESILTNQVLYVKKKEKILVLFILICGVINLGLNIFLILIGKFTASSAIGTTAISNFILVAIEYYYARKKLKVQIKLFEFEKIKYLLISLLFIPITIIIKQFTSSLIITILSVVIINATLYFLILIILKDKVINLFLDKIKQKIKK